MRIASSVAASVLLAAVAAAAPHVTVAPLEGAALAAAEAAARAALEPLAAGRVAVESGQAFAVVERGARMEVVAVRYAARPPAPLANVDRCALVVRRPERPARVVPTIGIGYTEALGCTGLDAVGFSDLDRDGRVDAALVYSTLAPPDRARKTPVVVRQDRDGGFAVDEARTAALDARGGITTIAGIREALR